MAAKLSAAIAVLIVIGLGALYYVSETMTHPTQRVEKTVSDESLPR